MSICLLNIFSTRTCVTTAVVYTCERIFHTSARTPENQYKHQQLYLDANSVVACRSEKCVTEGFKYAHWIGLYLSFHLNWVLGSFAHGRLQNLKTDGHFWPWHNPFNEFPIHSKVVSQTLIKRDWWEETLSSINHPGAAKNLQGFHTNLLY